MTTRAFYAALLLLAMPVAACNAAGPAMASPQEIARSLDGYTSRLKGAAVIVGIVDEGNVKVYESGDLGEGPPKLDETTIFQIGSVTKTFTTTLLASMVVDGQVRLEDPLQAYLPPGVRAPEFHHQHITLLALAEQNSGLPRLPENLGDDLTDPYASYTPAMLATFLSQYTLARAPGETYVYSNLGVGLLGDALARRAHESYAALLTRRILQPLHMSDTAMTLTPNMREKLAPGYLENGAPSKPWTFGDLGAAGGLYSNMRDMLRYLEANLAAPDGPLGPALAMAQKPRAADDSPHGETRVGLVWQTNVTNGNTFKNGQVGGYHAFIMLNRARRMGIVVLANVADSDVDTLALHLVYPTIVAAPLPPGFAPASAGEVSSVTARAKDWFHQLQSGNVDRAQLTPDFAARLTPQFLQQVRTGVAALGDPGGWVYLGAVKQGDVTIYTYRIRLGGAAREWSVGLAPDGKIAGSLLH